MQTVAILPTQDYRIWSLICESCSAQWDESTHDLWNVCALQCPDCGTMHGISWLDFHGDTVEDAVYGAVV